jgi:hypothetical protein
MRGTVEVHGKQFQWDLLAATGRAGYRLRVSAADVNCECNYPTRMSQPSAEHEAKRLAERMCALGRRDNAGTGSRQSHSDRRVHWESDGYASS